MIATRPIISNCSTTICLFLSTNRLNYYESFLKELDFHIGSRTRAGLIDLVEELKIRKEIVRDLLGKIRIIKEEAVSGNGATQRIALSYQRGFHARIISNFPVENI